MEVKINKDIREYTESIVLSLFLRYTLIELVKRQSFDEIKKKKFIDEQNEK